MIKSLIIGLWISHCGIKVDSSFWVRVRRGIGRRGEVMEKGPSTADGSSRERLLLNLVCESVL